MPTPPTAEPELLELMDRRATLLTAAPSAATTAELQTVTDALTARLAIAEPQVRRLTADDSPELLARLVAAEPVHPFDGADPAADLANRLADDRRCFVLEHPLLPDHPLNVVWVALWQGVASGIADVLDTGAPTLDPTTADTAVFYSIWNVEPGLVGVPGGSSLIEGAMEALQAELPALRRFVTLSPIPGFRAWTERLADGADEFTEADGGGGATDNDRLLRRCAEYLTSFGEDGRLLDAVARFHMGNGARLLRLNPDADRSNRGLARSYGVMANYHYEPEDRAANRDALGAGRPAVSEEISQLLAGASAAGPAPR